MIIFLSIIYLNHFKKKFLYKLKQLEKNCHKSQKFFTFLYKINSKYFYLYWKKYHELNSLNNGNIIFPRFELYFYKT